MAELATFTVAPPMRCSERLGHLLGFYCGQGAAVMRPVQAWTQPEYFCPQHAKPGDVPIAGPLIFRRVTVSLDVLFAAVTFTPVTAQAEALAALEVAVEQAGGLINLHGVTSAIGCWKPPAAVGQGQGGRRYPR